MSQDSLEITRRLIAETLLIPQSDIHVDSEIAQLKNIDSLSFEMIIVAIETETGKLIEPMHMFDLRTVGDLAKLL
ncbi:acyl carrier protein [Comamonas odontotermitis]|uniref:acyl carrier protein n=1 Tax=Comamonas odontotermitis TaxID=379895 RepID=UPI001CC75BDA|nr:acyl carrier protein [Comamonas odontotermitis]UBB15759.1 acyl carrier protein [Comamonas odontotermitis]